MGACKERGQEDGASRSGLGANVSSPTLFNGAVLPVNRETELRKAYLALGYGSATPNEGRLVSPYTEFK